MDSLTQIALGSAIGEAVGGRKLGNKAMFWGGVAGTIPDLDVFAKFFLSPIDALAAHRGFSHSILFSILCSLCLAFLIKSIYDSKWYRTIASTSYLLLTSLILLAINLLLYRNENWYWYTLILTLLLASGIIALVYRKYRNNNIKKPDFTRKQWAFLFFWSIFTHPLLDSFTAYGTQLFVPFSNYRVAFNNISIVDPIYTIFLLLAIIIAARIAKTSPYRKMINIIGLVLSSTYMLFTLYNKYRVSTIFKSNLSEKNIVYKRYMTNPTMLNNILWYGIAESDTAFHYGYYSLLDEEKKFELKHRKKTRAYIKQNMDKHIIGTLDWFSNGYNGVTPFVNDTAMYTDYRYGPLRIDGKDHNPFKMILIRQKDQSLKMIENTPATNKDIDMKKAFNELYKRIRF